MLCKDKTASFEDVLRSILTDDGLQDNEYLTEFEKMEVETLVDCNVFVGVDEPLISWIIGRLENEDMGAKLNGKTIPELCVERRKQHFGKNLRSEYFIF